MSADADVRRLNWLEVYCASIEPVLDMDPEAETGWLVTSYGGSGYGEGTTLRDAIDAAIADMEDSCLPERPRCRGGTGPRVRGRQEQGRPVGCAPLRLVRLPPPEARPPLPGDEAMSDKPVFIVERKEPGTMVGRIAMLDERIIVDDYDPKHPDVLWYCDHCGVGSPVTAQFDIAESDHYNSRLITLCAGCLQRALDGIAYSLANPVSFDDPNYGKEEP